MPLEDCRFHIICVTCEEIYKNGTLFYSNFPENADRVKKNHNKTFKAHVVEIRDRNVNS